MPMRTLPRSFFQGSSGRAAALGDSFSRAKGSRVPKIRACIAQSIGLNHGLLRPLHFISHPRLKVRAHTHPSAPNPNFISTTTIPSSHPSRSPVPLPIRLPRDSPRSHPCVNFLTLSGTRDRHLPESPPLLLPISEQVHRSEPCNFLPGTAIINILRAICGAQARAPPVDTCVLGGLPAPRESKPDKEVL